MPTARTLLTSLFLGLPFLVAPAILFAAPRPDMQAAADVRPAPAATLAATPGGTLKAVPASLTGKAAAPCDTGHAVAKVRAGHAVPRRLVALN